MLDIFLFSFAVFVAVHAKTFVLFCSCLPVLFFAYRITIDAFIFLVAKRLGIIRCIHQEGDWAIVTGGGSGIGAGYAHALGKRGINVCLVGRSSQNLEIVAASLKELNVQTLVIVHDYANTGEAARAELEKKLKHIYSHVSILINNVGVLGGSENFGVKYTTMVPNPIKIGQEILDVNVSSCIYMTGLLLPYFIAARRGTVINLSSVCSVRPMWGCAVYCATKAFIAFYSDALRQELKQTGIIIQTVTPSFVRTRLLPERFNRNLFNGFAVTPEYFAISALNTIGLQHSTDGCFEHSIQNNGLRTLDLFVPRFIVDKGVKVLTQYLGRGSDEQTKKP